MSELNITNIQYNAEYDDYDVTCTMCGQCFVCPNESAAMNVLFNHIRAEHNLSISK